MSKSKYIAVDFDGTCVMHEFPKVGKDVGAVPILKSLVNAGHKLILHTMRSGQSMKDALYWFLNNEIDLYAVNENPSQSSWTASRKVYAHVYIDDAALGIPLIHDLSEERPYVNWNEVEKLLEIQGFLPVKAKTTSSQQY